MISMRLTLAVAVISDRIIKRKINNTRKINVLNMNIIHVLKKELNP